MRKWLLLLVALIALVAAGLAAAFLSPWPGVLIIRAIFDQGAAAASARLEPLVPPDVAAVTLSYDPGDADAVFDIYRGPDADAEWPVVVWVHGGGFVSGRRSDIANYLKILAGEGFVVVNVDYTIAPEARYPTPLRQLDAALRHLAREGERLGIGGSGFVIAGDSAGAQIAAQTVALATSPDYGARLGIDGSDWRARMLGVALFCGVYDISGLGRGGGLAGLFVQTTGWAYSGVRSWRTAPEFATIDFLPHLTADFPAAFITAGNADPLAPQSVALAEALEAAGVEVETLFFPADHRPALGHEYQFDLGSAAGRLAFERLVAWLRQR